VGSAVCVDPGQKGKISAGTAVGVICHNIILMNVFIQQIVLHDTTSDFSVTSFGLRADHH